MNDRTIGRSSEGNNSAALNARRLRTLCIAYIEAVRQREIRRFREACRYHDKQACVVVIWLWIYITLCIPLIAHLDLSCSVRYGEAGGLMT